ncbi:hypothetical protein CXB51_013753 [Gossypium anomalum]|uniref:Aminotransferase-like plant mobile domain-containing protein n=1 Tax=Gossypium anomalum TaxID=47600 RepID=A0A8J5YWR2_9ROSI|nr:hypothetical protein CXB51_013753 [Gossypium anomalum]
MIGGYLMPDLLRNLVHLRWLLKLVDFRAGGQLSWGFTVLETLYREMYGTMPPNKVKIRGCLSLLQLWARFHFPFLRPRVNHPYTFPLITRWNHPTSYVGIPTALEDIWLLSDRESEAQFQWTPYEDPITRAVISEEFFQNPNIWIHGKPYLLTEEQRRRQIDIERERQGPLNPRRMDDNTGLSTAHIQSPGPTLQPTTPTAQPL